MTSPSPESAAAGGARRRRRRATSARGAAPAVANEDPSTVREASFDRETAQVGTTWPKARGAHAPLRATTRTRIAGAAAMPHMDVVAIVTRSPRRNVDGARVVRARAREISGNSLAQQAGEFWLGWISKRPPEPRSSTVCDRAFCTAKRPQISATTRPRQIGRKKRKRGCSPLGGQSEEPARRRRLSSASGAPSWGWRARWVFRTP
jgi:hypothetical protein